MFRIRDLEALTKEGNYVFTIQYRDENGEAHFRDESTFQEDIHRELEDVVIMNSYTEEGLPEIAYVVYLGEENIHYEPDMTKPITLLEFAETFHTNTDEDIEVHCPDAPSDCDGNLFITGFEIVKAEDGVSVPSVILHTSDTFIQMKLPEMH